MEAVVVVGIIVLIFFAFGGVAGLAYLGIWLIGGTIIAILGFLFKKWRVSRQSPKADASDGLGAPLNDYQPERKQKRMSEKTETVKVGDFGVGIPEGELRDDAYVVLDHGQQYTLVLENNSWHRADAVVEIDGKEVGKFRVNSASSIELERPADDDGHFTFYEIESEEANSIGLKANQELGLIRVEFRPERFRDSLAHAGGLTDSIARAGDLVPVGTAGGTGLSGHSDQNFVTVSALEFDPDEVVVIHVRLAGRVRKDAPRPLVGRSRSNPVPPTLA